MGNAEVLVPNTTTAYREILQTKDDCFVKPQESRTGAIIVIGEGLPWAHGNIHRLRRTALNSKLPCPLVVYTAYVTLEMSDNIATRAILSPKDEGVRAQG